MKKKQKKVYSKIIYWLKYHKKDLKVVLLGMISTFILFIAYSFGNLHCLLSGINVVIEIEDLNICDLLDLEEEEGYCILNEKAKYNQEMSCYFGDFKVKGGIEPEGAIKTFIDIRNFIMGHLFLRCWG